MEVPPSYGSDSLPDYSSNAYQTERSGASTVAFSRTRTSQPQAAEEYQYTHRHLIVNMGPKRSRMFRPIYGWNAVVEGYVQIKKKPRNVQSIVASVEGRVTTGVTERGFLLDHNRAFVLQTSQTLFEASSGERTPTGEERYGFSFALPSYVTGGTDPLPPSFSALHMGLTVDVSYSIKVEMMRKGRLRQNERIITAFYYLPRTFAPFPQCQLLGVHDEKPESNDQLSLWRSFDVLPIPPQGAVAPAVTDLRVSLALQQPLVYACGSTIPFILKITSSVVANAVSLLFSTLSVQLIRATTIQFGTKRTEYETLLGGGEVFRVKEDEGEREMFGSVACSRLGESSWQTDSVTVKYIMRVKVSPRRDMPSLAFTLPTYLRDVPITMRTDQKTLDGSEDIDATMPALCMLSAGTTRGSG